MASDRVAVRNNYYNSYKNCPSNNERDEPSIESYVLPTAESAILPSAYSTKIVPPSRSKPTIVVAQSTSKRNTKRQVPTVSPLTASQPASNRRETTLTAHRTLRLPASVSPLTASLPLPLKQATLANPAPASTLSDTVEDLLSLLKDPAMDPTMLLDFDEIPEEFWTLAAEAPAVPYAPYSAPFAPLTAAAPFPAPAHEQTLIPHSSPLVPDAGTEALIDDLIANIDTADFEGDFDVDDLFASLPVEEQEEDPLREFFPMLPSTSSMSPSRSDPFLSDLSVPFGASSYTDLSGPAHHPVPASYDYCDYASDLSPGGTHAWVKMGDPMGGIDHSPTFMDTNCDIEIYLNEIEAGPSAEEKPPVMATSTPPVTTASRSTVTSARYAPYKRQTATPCKRQPVFRPIGYGTPLEGETVNDYRTRRDKNNASSANSRRKKAERLREMKEEAKSLERRNIELKAISESLEREVADYKQMLMGAARA